MRCGRLRSGHDRCRRWIADPRDPYVPGMTGTAHEFDFWIGEWDVFGPAGDHLGVNSVRPLFDTGALAEHWRSDSGIEGHSLNCFDQERHCWHQTWVDSSGEMLQLDGGLRDDGAMVLEGQAPNGEDPTAVDRQRITWTRVSDSDGAEVRQLGVLERRRRDLDRGVRWAVPEALTLDTAPGGVQGDQRDRAAPEGADDVGLIEGDSGTPGVHEEGQAQGRGVRRGDGTPPGAARAAAVLGADQGPQGPGDPRGPRVGGQGWRVIKTITERTSPRIVHVAALPKPTERERTQWYFQRYVERLPPPER